MAAGVPAGRLSIEIVAEIARLQQDLDKAKRAVRAASGDIAKSARAANDNLSAIGRGSAAGLQKFSAEVARLKSQVDPGWASMQKYKDEVFLLSRALREGAITQEQYTANLIKTRAAFHNGTLMMTRSAGQMRMGLQQLSFQVGDVGASLASGSSLMVIFAQQVGQVGQAVQMMGGGASAFTRFLGGPWMAAITAAISLLGGLFMAHSRAKESADDNAKAHESLADKLNLQKHSLEEVTAATREYNGEQARSRDITLDAARATLANAKANIQAAITERQKLQALLEGQGGRIDENGRAIVGTFRGSQIAQQMADNARALETLRDGLQNAVGDVATEMAKIATDPAYAIEDRFKRLRNEATASIKDVDKLAKRLANLNREEKSALDALRDHTRSGGSANSTAARVGDMTALIKQLFPTAQITATTNGKHAKNSDHYAGRAIDFVIPGMMNAAGTAFVEGMLEAAGADIRRNAKGTEQFFGPGRSANKPGDHDNHFHAAFDSLPDSDRVIEAQQRERERQAEAEQRARDLAARRQFEFAERAAGLDAQIADAKAANLIEARDIANAARAQLQAENDKLVLDIQGKVRSGEYNVFQAALLLNKQEQVQAERQMTIAVQEQARIAAELMAVQSAANDNQRDLLDAQDALATTAGARRDIALRLLALDEAEERARQQTVLASQAATEADRQIAQARLDLLAQLHSLRVDRVLQDTSGPLETYLSDIPRTAAEINEQIQRYTVDELEAVRNGINDALMDAIGVKDPMIAGLLDLFIQQVLIRPITEALQKASAGSGSGVGGLLSVIGGLFGGMGGGSSSAIAVNGGMNMTGAIATLPRFARGTSFARGGWSLVGEEGPEVVNLPRGSQVIPNNRLTGNDNGPSGEVHFHFPSVTNVREAREAGGQAAREFRRKLNGPVRS